MMRSVSIAFVVLSLALSCKANKSEPAVDTEPAGQGAKDKEPEPKKLTPEEFAAEFEKQCTEKNMDACRNLALLYAEGAGVPRDEAKARELLDAACEGKNVAACTNLGLFLSNGYGGETDSAGAIAAWTRACDGGHLLGCRNLGLVYRDGRSVKADGKRAVEFFAKACDGDLGYACNNLAAMLRDGKLTKADPERALKLFVKACDLKDAAGCRNVGSLYAGGGGGLKKGYPAAAVWFKRACDGADPVGCRALGMMKLEGAGVKKDEAEARRLLSAACSRKDLLACETMVKKDWATRSTEPLSAEEQARMRELTGKGETKNDEATKEKANTP